MDMVYAKSQIWFSSWVEGLSATQEFWSMMDSNETVQTIIRDANRQLQDEIETIMASDQVQDALAQTPVEERDNVEEEARRYVDGTIRATFVDELTPRAQETYEHHEWASTSNFGWLPWAKWRLYRVGRNAKALDGMKIRYAGTPVGSSTYLVTSVIARTLGSSEVAVRKIEDEGAMSDALRRRDGGAMPNARNQTKTIWLTRSAKQHISVYDPNAFSLSQAGKLRWYEWCEYRGTLGSGKMLVNKEVYFDREQPGCDDLLKSYKSDPSNPCLGAIIGDNADVGYTVRRARWKPLWIEDRFLVLDSHLACQRPGLRLSSKVKGCLLVKDAEAYERASRDAGRRQLDEAWRSGANNACINIAHDVTWAMTAPANKASLNDIIFKKCGASSVVLDRTEELGNTSSGTDGQMDMAEREKDEELLEIERAIDEGFAKAEFVA